MRLLVAEDEHSLSKAIVTILIKNHYSADAVYNGEEALNYLENQVYDGLILDIMMPKMDGLSLLKLIRQKGMTIPVLILSAKGENDDIVEGLDLGANDYLAKPFSTDVLLARIRAMTRNTNIQPSSLLTLGNITLNQSTFLLSSSHGSFRLTNKEYQILEMLMANPTSVICAERFLEKVWGYDTETDINTVWVYISYLRKKLETLHATIKIKAIRNTGYLLEEKK